MPAAALTASPATPRLMGRRSRRAWVLLAALVVMALTARLGWWQLDRGAQKQALQLSMQQRASLPPLTGEQLARTDEAAVGQHHQRIVLQGQWLPGHTVFLDNRQMAGRPGFFVLDPLLLPGGEAVLVQRGWVPRDLQDRTRLPNLPLPAGRVQLTARVAPWPSRLADLGADAPGPIRQNLAAADYATQIGRPLRPVSLLMLAEPALAGDGLLRDWPLPALDVHKHWGYAGQWFSFCALTAGLYVWFQLIQPWRRRHAG